MRKNNALFACAAALLWLAFTGTTAWAQSDQWAATDALGRELPNAQQTGPPRKNKWVGVFYFLWLGEHGDAGPFDISDILRRDKDAPNKPNSSLWGPVSAPHHWGQSVFGYYRSSDEWVLRKHAQMLSDAGVDVVIFDTTNQLTYPRSYLALCKVWTQIRSEGGKTPQIAFLTPFGDSSQVVQTLYHDLYEPGLYRPLWFQWENKPLILANPSQVTAASLRRSQRVPGLLRTGETIGQSFHAMRPFDAVGGSFPTYQSTNSGVTLSLYRGAKPSGSLVARRVLTNLKDNAVALVQTSKPLPPGDYYLEQSAPVGQVGWWSQTGTPAPQSQAWENRQSVNATRSLFVQWTGEPKPSTFFSDTDAALDTADAQRRASAIRAFFAFRKGQPDYFSGPLGPEPQWGWLDVFPQKPYGKTPNGGPEEVTVGVAQNAVDGKLGVLSNPRAQGRSFHNGTEPDKAHQDTSGRNFAEQWERALQLDPSFIFITGWNEWIAGRFNQDAPFHGATPVTFVDEFDEEGSRDIEPVARPSKSGDNYYYQMVAGIRRFKGVASNPTPNPPRTWRTYSDDAFDTQHRNEKAWSVRVGENGVYRNTTGRNDFMRLSISHDTRLVSFRAETREVVRDIATPGTMQLFVAPKNAQTKNAPNWEGYLFAINRNGKKPGNFVTIEKRTAGGKWQIVGKATCELSGKTMTLRVPRALLGFANQSTPIALDFKWMDNVRAETDMLNLYRNGDAAPNCRFRYRYDGAKLKSPPAPQ